MIETLTPDFEHSDSRGKLTQLVHGGCAQVNVIYTLAGERRGRMHFHRRNYETFYVISGKLLLRTFDGQHEFNSGDMFRIPPDVAHDFEFSENTLLVSMYSQGINLENGTKDIWETE
jgi:quercetin dioxygenase-like cupin family protein